jgi:dynein heavy chain
MLQCSLTKLASKYPEKYTAVKVFPLNPKSLSLSELYGEFNISTNEWTDGVLSSVMRLACSDEKKDQKWILFDGPVDTLWIESMNTVLDDNKVLTLINGERIALPEQVSLLFEVENLSTASPATVSRVGMIYMDYADLGWRPFFNSWLEKKEQKQSVEILKNLVDRYLPTLLEFKKSCSELVPVSEPSVIRSLFTLFDCVAIEENGVLPDTPEFPKMLELWLLFCIIWTVGGTLTESSRKKFDMFLREIDGQFPSKNTVFEYYVDKQNKTWQPWENKLQNGWKFPNNIPFYKIFVPTVDTIRNEFIVRSLIRSKKPLLLVGDVGTGKTSLIQTVLASNDDKISNSTLLFINSSAQTSSNAVQNMIESKLEKRTKNVYIPVGGKQLITFIDDFNMPQKDTFGSQVLYSLYNSIATIRAYSSLDGLWFCLRSS